MILQMVKAVFSSMTVFQVVTINGLLGDSAIPEQRAFRYMSEEGSSNGGEVFLAALREGVRGWQAGRWSVEMNC